MKIGFIGLGAMGGPIAENLIRAGHSLFVYDANAERVAELVACGAAAPGNRPADIAREAQIVFTCLPGPSEIEAVALGEGALIETMAAGSTWVDLTTNSPSLVRRLGERFAARGIHMLDAPISGGPKGARSRKLALWIGGDKVLFERHLEVLKAIGDAPEYIGPLGSGSVVKLVHNCASFAMQAAMAETFTLGVKAGVDPLTLFKALREGTTGRMRTFDRLAAQFLSGNYDPAAFALRLAQKDMKLGLELAGEFELFLPVCEIAMQDMTEAMRRGWGNRDARIAMSLLEERAGVSVRVPSDALRKAME